MEKTVTSSKGAHVIMENNNSHKTEMAVDLEDENSRKNQALPLGGYEGVLKVYEYQHLCNLTESPACTRCSATVESVLHCLRDCPHSNEVWLMLGALRWQNFLHKDVAAWSKLMPGTTEGSVCGLVVGAMEVEEQYGI